MNFWDRLLFLAVSGYLLFLGGASIYSFLAVRNIVPGSILNERMVGQLILIKVLAFPAAIILIGIGLWTFYRALKE